MRSLLVGRIYRVLAVAGAALLVLALIVLTVQGPSWAASRQRAVAFKGIIEDKAILFSGGRARPTSLRYILVIRQKTGEVVRFPVTGGIYAQAREGMPVRKRAGEQWPALGVEAKSACAVIHALYGDARGGT